MSRPAWPATRGRCSTSTPPTSSPVAERLRRSGLARRGGGRRAAADRRQLAGGRRERDAAARHVLRARRPGRGSSTWRSLARRGAWPGARRVTLRPTTSSWSTMGVGGDVELSSPQGDLRRGVPPLVPRGAGRARRAGAEPPAPAPARRPQHRPDRRAAAGPPGHCRAPAGARARGSGPADARAAGAVAEAVGVGVGQRAAAGPPPDRSQPHPRARSGRRGRLMGVNHRDETAWSASPSRCSERHAAARWSAASGDDREVRAGRGVPKDM